VCHSRCVRYFASTISSCAHGGHEKEIGITLGKRAVPSESERIRRRTRRVPISAALYKSKSGGGVFVVQPIMKCNNLRNGTQSQSRRTFLTANVSGTVNLGHSPVLIFAMIQGVLREWYRSGGVSKTVLYTVHIVWQLRFVTCRLCLLGALPSDLLQGLCP